MSFKQLCQDLEQEIQTSYEQGVSMVDAERLAGKFLAAQIKVSDELKKSDLDARLRKSGVKSISTLYRSLKRNQPRQGLQRW